MVHRVILVADETHFCLHARVQKGTAAKVRFNASNGMYDLQVRVFLGMPTRRPTYPSCGSST